MTTRRLFLQGSGLMAQLLGQRLFGGEAQAAGMAGVTASFYHSGATTLAPVYQDPRLVLPWHQPVAANHQGAFPDLYLDPAIAYRLVFHQSDGRVIRTVDPINPIPGSGDMFAQTGIGAGPRAVNEKLRERISVEDFYQNTSQDATAWSRAFDRVRALGGGSIYCTAPTYLMTAQVVLQATDLQGPVTIEGGGALIRTQGAISALRIEGSSTPVSIKVANLGVLQAGQREAIAGFEQAGTANVTWDCCNVTANGEVSPRYGGWLLRHTDPDNGDTGCFWTRFPGSAVRSQGGITVPNGVILDGAMNATNLQGLYLTGVVNGVLMTHPTGSTLAPDRKPSANSVRIQGAWIEGATNAVTFQGEVGGYGPYGLLIDLRLEAVGTVLSLQGATHNHGQPPLILLQETLQSVETIVENPNRLIVNVMDFRINMGRPGETVLATSGGWRLFGVEPAGDVLTVESANGAGGLALKTAGAVTARLRQVASGSGKIAELTGNLAGGTPLSLKTVRGVSSSDVHASNLTGAKVLSGGGAQVTFPRREANADYEIWLQGEGHETFVVSAKSPAGFIITSSNRSSNARVAWLLVR